MGGGACILGKTQGSDGCVECTGDDLSRSDTNGERDKGAGATVGVGRLDITDGEGALG